MFQSDDDIEEFIISCSLEALVSVQIIASKVGAEMFPIGKTWDERDRLEVWNTAILVWQHRQPLPTIPA